MRKGLLITVAATALALGCSRDIEPHTGDDTADTNIEDTDTDTDSDTEPDTDTDTGTTGPQLDCQADYSGDTPVPGSDGNLGECVTSEVFCGDRVFATTTGGSTWYGDDWGSGGDEQWIDYLDCTGDLDLTDDFGAPERVYVLDATEVSGYAEVRLDAECGDLALRVVRSAECAPKTVETTLCEEVYEDGDVQYHDVMNPGYKYAIVVEGVNGYTGNFELEVDCTYAR